MRVLLLNLPWSKGSRLGIRAGSRWPFTSPAQKEEPLRYLPFPFFLAYATSLLKKEKRPARLIDAVAEGLDERAVGERIKDFSPDLLVAETSTPSFNNDLRIINNIRKNNPAVSIVLCGPHASVFPEQILRENQAIKYVLVGEYEYTLSELVNSLENNLNLGSVFGLAYRGEKDIKVNPLRPAIEALDGLPWPERDDLPVYRYNDAFAGLPIPNVQMLSSRGCPFKCGFCLWPQTIYGEHRYRPRDPAKVIDEMEYLLGRFDFKAVYFDDDTFNIDKAHVLAICGQMMKRKIKIPWAIMARPDLMDEEILRALFEAGLYAVKYGVESADERVLRSSGKELDLGKAKENILFTKKLGIKTHLTFCLGLKGETRESIEKTLCFKEEVSADSSQFSLAVPFPGTEYFKYLKKNSLLASEDWDDYDGNYKCVVKNPDLGPEELESIYRGLR